MTATAWTMDRANLVATLAKTRASNRVLLDRCERLGLPTAVTADDIAAHQFARALRAAERATPPDPNAAAHRKVLWDALRGAA